MPYYIFLEQTLMFFFQVPPTVAEQIQKVETKQRIRLIEEEILKPLGWKKTQNHSKSILNIGGIHFDM